MSDLEKTIAIIFSGVDELSRPLDKMSSNIDSFGNDLQDIGQPFADAAEKVMMMNAAVLALAAAGLKASSDIETESQKMANSLGLPTEQALKFKEVALDAYKAGWGENLTAAFTAATLAQKKFGDDASVDLGKVVEQAFKIEETFGVDVSESLGGVKTLMSQFGLTSDEAFDFVVTGFQKGLNSSGDFIESINEYGVQFQSGGANAGQFFSVMETGFHEGMLGTDRAADAFKEFRVRIQDGSKTTKEALESIGIDPAALEANLASGKITAMDAFGVIQKALNDTRDESVKLNAGVGLMGTQFEDLGTKTGAALSTTKTSIEDMTGALDKMDFSTFEKSFLSLIRTITTDFGNLKEWNEVKENLAKIFEDIAASFGPAMEKVDFSGLEKAVKEIWLKLQSVLSDNGLDITTVEGMEKALQRVVESIKSLTKVTEGIVDVLGPIFTAIVKIVDGFNKLPSEFKELAGILMGLGTALVSVGASVKIGGVLLAGLGSLVGMVGSGGAIATGIIGLVSLLTGPVGLAVALAGAGLALKKFAESGDLGTWAEKTSENIKKVVADIATDFANIGNASTENLSDTSKALLGIGESAKKATDEITKIYPEIELIPSHKVTDFSASVDRAALHIAMMEMNKIPDEKNPLVKLTPDAPSFEKTTKSLAAITAHENKMIEIQLQGDVEGDLIRIQGDVDMELARLEGDIEASLLRITTQAEMVQTAFEWEAKLDIAQIEADAKMAVAAFDSVASSVESTASATADMFSALVGNWENIDGFMAKGNLMFLIEKQMAMEQQALDTQKELVAAQIEFMQAKSDALKEGDGLIKIESDGLEPALEMVMWQILEKVQLRATEEAAEFLLGLGTGDPE